MWKVEPIEERGKLRKAVYGTMVQFQLSPLRNTNDQ